MNNKPIIIGGALLCLIVGVQFYQNIRLNSKLVELDTTLTEHISVSKDVIVMPEGFDYVYDRFALYNANIDTQTVRTYLAVVDTFGLRKDTTHFDWLIGQVILESGARQFYENGSVLRGTSGEVGMTQIMPSTGLEYLAKIKDPTILYNLGAENFSFAYDKSIKKADKIALTIQWLTNTQNNLILWGFIMKSNMEKNGLLKGLVAYNAGSGGMRKFISKFKQPEKHAYIKSIQSALFYVDENV